MTAPPPAGMLTITLFVRGILRNPLNTRGSLRASIARGLAWKRLTRVAWMVADRPTWPGPAVVQMTAYTTKLWDEQEGLGAALKHVRDEAVRLILDGNPPRRQDRRGQFYDVPANDGRTSGHVFPPPLQEIRTGDARGVLIEVTPR